ncbi:MAG: alpha/beta fold hydrolase [Lachnospiraceae bacterium]|nr:alpha/beta fold hydrolase [Lachnospiraceae bacterium]
MRINVNGVDLYYEKGGVGRPLVLVHGNSVDHNEFKNSIWLLRRHFTVYAVDSRAHGLSSKVDELHYTDMADDMVEFLEKLDLRDVVFFGHSDGAIIGLLTAMKTDRIGLLLAGSANSRPDVVPQWLRLGLKAVCAVTRDPKMQMMLREPDLTAEKLGTIKTPTVVIAGSKDLVPESDTRFIAESVPGAGLRIMEGDDHTSYVVPKTRLADLILEETGITEKKEGGGITPSQFKTLLKAQQGEADAVLMYRKLADKVSDEADRKAFLRLADDEARHESVFLAYTGKSVKANPAKSIVVPAMYKMLGKEKTYPVIAKGEYEAADKYKDVVRDFPEVEEVMNDEVHHGDAVMDLLKK